MICYRDMTFCASDCVNKACHRFVSAEIESRAKSLDLPIARSDFSNDCTKYQSPQVQQ